MSAYRVLHCPPTAATGISFGCGWWTVGPSWLSLPSSYFWRFFRVTSKRELEDMDLPPLTLLSSSPTTVDCHPRPPVFYIGGRGSTVVGGERSEWRDLACLSMSLLSWKSSSQVSNRDSVVSLAMRRHV